MFNDFMVVSLRYEMDISDHQHILVPWSQQRSLLVIFTSALHSHRVIAKLFTLSDSHR